MRKSFLLAISAAAAVASLEPVQARCVISPDQKSIDVVTDNPSSDEKNCAVKCKVDTKKGVAQISCGGNAPPLAKGYSVCGFEKPEPWYFKVLSSEDSCSNGAEPSSGSAEPPPAKRGDSVECRISADGKSVDAMIDNPYPSATSCQVDCQVSTTKPGTTMNVSCTKTVDPGSKAVVCTQTFDKGRLVKMVGGKGACINPTAPDEDAQKDDDAQKGDDVDVESLAKDAQKNLQKMMKELHDQ